MGRPQLRTAALRERFVEEAVAVIEDQGIDSLTTRKIAVAADSSLAALNELFGGKAGLLAAAALHGFSMLGDALDQQDDDLGSPIQAVLSLCHAHREFTASHPRLLTLMYSRPFADFDPSEEDVARAASIRRRFTTRTAQLSGLEYSDPAVIDLAVGLVSLLEGLTRQRQAGTLGSTEDSADRRWRAAIDNYIDGMQRAPLR